MEERFDNALKRMSQVQKKPYNALTKSSRRTIGFICHRSNSSDKVRFDGVCSKFKKMEVDYHNEKMKSTR